MFPLPNVIPFRLLKRVAPAVLLLGAATAALAQSPGPEAASVARSGTRISVSGHVAPATVEAVKREFAAPDGARIDSLVVSSTGGDVEPLIELGRLVHARKMTIQVERVCAGMCATFLAPAAERLLVPRGSLLVYFPIFYSQNQMAIQAAGTPDEAKFREALARQAAYFRELGIDHDNAYAIGETALVVKAALAATGKPDQPLIVPDSNYLRKCLGIGSVDMPDYTIADSNALAHVSQHTPIAFLIGGKIYYEGSEVATFAPSCSAG